MPRLCFEKKGNAIWLSHLDLMRLFQRAFKRAGLPLKHSNGFSPRPMLSIALPLSVGIESYCEILDFELDCVTLTADQILLKLNDALISGVRVLSVYDSGRPLRELTYLNCQLSLEYDEGIPEHAQEAIIALLSSDTLLVEKHSKNGATMQDIIPLIKRFSVDRIDSHTLVLFTCIHCQNPTLNPMQVASAISTMLPEYRPDFFKISRLEALDDTDSLFQ